MKILEDFIREIHFLKTLCKINWRSYHERGFLTVSYSPRIIMSKKFKNLLIAKGTTIIALWKYFLTKRAPKRSWA